MPETENHSERSSLILLGGAALLFLCLLSNPLDDFVNRLPPVQTAPVRLGPTYDPHANEREQYLQDARDATADAAAYESYIKTQQAHEQEPPPIDAVRQRDGGCPEGCAVPPVGCTIKGNISMNSGEKIYHVPGQKWHSETVIDPEYGEAWFCTEAEARANGFRKAYE